MALATYTDLQTAVAEWLARTGDTLITNRAPDFILLAEQRILYGNEVPFKSEPLRIAAMETAFSINTTGGTDTIALPSGYVGTRSIYVDGSPNQRLDYVTPSQRQDIWMESTAQGKPNIYTIIGTNFALSPTPDTIYTIKGFYYQKLPSLLSNSTNWLMTNAPGIYLNAALLEAALYISDDDAVNRYGKQFASAINSLQSQDEVDRHSGAPLVMLSDTGNP